MKNSSEKFLNGFSLLLCTYKGDSPQHLKECLDSILASTVYPSELIIVKDGPLTTELEEVIADTVFPFETNIISLPKSQTQGIARQKGVAIAKYRWIALMDSDDVMASDRFEKQLAEIAKNPKIDIIGGQIKEFNYMPSKPHAIRKTPHNHLEILAWLKKRNPFNAMTVMFKKELALESGNFRYFPGFEDYDIWVRMIKKGAVCQNCDDILVYVRTGYGMFSRRRGLSYIKHEWRMQRLLRNMDIITNAQFIKNLLVRIPVRLLPQKALEGIYMKFLRNNT